MSTQQRAPRALVTGASRGIGLALCSELKAAGWEVIAAARTKTSEIEALEVRWETLDVTSESSVAELATRLDGVKLDLLVLNAGVSISDNIDALNFPAMMTQFDVNTLGPLRVTVALLESLSKGSKVAIVSSRMG